MPRRKRTFTHGWKHSPFARKRIELAEKVDAFGWPPFTTHGAWNSVGAAPDVDMFVRNAQLVARMDLPGLTKEDVAIELGDGELTIHGMLPHAPETAHEHTETCACELGLFSQTIPLPDGVRSGDVTVTFTDGILELAMALPSKAAAHPGLEIQETDIRVRDAVVRELDWDPDLDASAVGVETLNGIVTLTGYVDDDSARVAAERTARRVQGVRGVTDDIEVRLKPQRPDVDIAKDAAHTLRLRPSVPGGVRAIVRSGCVTLTGEVASFNQKRDAEDAVRYVAGTEGVMNRIRVSTAESDLQ
jgi:osmotically-inducible protein OsmY